MSLLPKWLRAVTWVFLLIAVPLASAAIAGWIHLLLPPTYTAKASLMVRFGSEYTFRPIVGSSESITPWRPDSIINSELEILNSDEVKDLTVDRLGARRLVGQPPQSFPNLFSSQAQVSQKVRAREVLRKGLSMKMVSDSNVIHLDYSSSDPSLAADALSNLIEAYYQRRSQVYADQTLGFLSDQLNLRETELKHAKDALAAAKPEQSLGNYQDDRRVLVEHEVALLGQKDLIHKAGLELQDVAGSSTEAFAGGQAKAVAQQTKGVSLIAEQQAVDEDITKVHESLKALDVREQQLETMTAQVDVTQHSVDEVRARYDEARLTAAMEQAKLTNVKLLDSPQVPELRSGLSLFTTALLAGLIGLLGVIALMTFTQRILVRQQNR